MQINYHLSNIIARFSHTGINLRISLQFPQILESEELLESPITTDECLRQSLKLEAMLGFKLSTTDSMISDVLHEKDIDDDDNLIGNIFDQLDDEI